MKRRVDYDRIAPVYNHRFAHDWPADRGRALVDLAQKVQPNQVLEVACGTGHWLTLLRPQVPRVFGLDLSLGMLNQAQARPVPLNLAQGRAEELPYRNDSLDMVFCVNAIHHFDDPRMFVAEAHRALRPGGTVAIVGSDPHSRMDSWYVYHYFDTTYATDLARFPIWPEVTGWLKRSGFENANLNEVERVDDPKHGREVLDDPYLRKHACSQLALLTEKAYATGLDKIKASLARAERHAEPIIFQSTFTIEMLVGTKSGSPEK
jgi:ubiquinone/menaquinone biosynthesis C-methylase UbiE